MRSVITTILVAVFTLSFTVSAEAQLMKRLKKKAQNAAAKKAEEKLAAEIQQRADQMVEKSWNSIFGDINKTGEDESGNGIFRFGSNVKTEDNYRFSTVTTMEIQSFDKKGKSEPPVIMKMHFNEDEMYTGSKFSGEEMNQEHGDVFIIYDFKNSAMVMLMESEEDKFSFAYDWQQTFREAEILEDLNEEESNSNEAEEWKDYTKIGTKNIAGYSCDGYRSESEDAISEVWITNEANFGMPAMIQANANAKQLRGKMPTDYPIGMLMEMQTENLENGDKTTMKVTEINKNADVSYLMSEYPSMSLGKTSK